MDMDMSEDNEVRSSFLDREILKSETLRNTLLFYVFIILAIIGGILPSIFSFMIGHSITPFFIVALYFVTIAIYFMFRRIRTVHLLSRNLKQSLYIRYINTFLEVSIPTVAILANKTLQSLWLNI